MRKNTIVNLLNAAIIFCQFIINIEGMDPKPQGRLLEGGNVQVPIGPVALITGASSGIGLELIRALLEESTVKLIFATSRRHSPELKMYTDVYSKENYERRFIRPRMKRMMANSGLVHANIVVDFVEMDVANESSVKYAAVEMKRKLGEYARFFKEPALHLNTLINNAGLMDTFSENPGVHPLETPTHETYMRHFEVNTIGAVMVTAALHHQMPKGQKARIVFISSTISSMKNFPGMREHQNTVYAMSKAALNYYMLTINSFDKWLTMSICPGWVDTKMGSKVGKGNDGIKGTERTAQRLVKVIDGMHEETNGQFYSMHEIKDTNGEVKELGMIDF